MARVPGWSIMAPEKGAGSGQKKILDYARPKGWLSAIGQLDPE